jgi:hypothetical protein
MANNFIWIDENTLNGNLWDNGILSSATPITQIGILSIVGSSNKYLYIELNNTGTISQNISNYTLFLNNSASINNSGVYEFQAGTISNALSSEGSFNNSGIFRLTKSSTGIMAVPFYNTGTVKLELGALLLLGGGSSNGGTFDIASGKTLEFRSTYSLNNNTQITGTGTLLISGGFLELDGDWALPTTTINIVNGGGIKSSGTVTNAGALTIQGRLALYAPLNNTGTIVQNLLFSDSSSALSLNNSASINNSGVYEFQAGTISNALSSEGSFNNSGIFRLTKSGTAAIVAVSFYNTGTVEALSGTVTFYNDYTHNNANLILKGGNLSFSKPLTINGGKVEGNGSINVGLTNSGLLNPRYASNTEFGRLTINSNYIETNSASINIQLGGNTAGTNFDQVDINGTANFDGTLNVNLLNSFNPTLGSTFDVLTYDSLNSSSNLDFTGLSINSTLQFLPQWFNNKLTLKVVEKSFTNLAIAATNANQTEGNSGSKAFTFTVTRTGNTTATNTVNWVVTGTGTNPANATDFVGGVLPSGTVTFAANSTSQVISVSVNGDTTFEPNETFTVNLFNPNNGAALSTATATGTITNDDLPSINLSPNGQTVVEGLTSPQNLSYTVSLSSSSTQTITVQYSTANGTALAGSDYTTTTGTLTFSPGVTSQTITIPILNNSVNEANETFTLKLTSPTNAILGGTATVTTTITDTLSASTTTTLAANVENLTLTGIYLTRS